jgi:hypothetical protein
MGPIRWMGCAHSSCLAKLTYKTNSLAYTSKNYHGGSGPWICGCCIQPDGDMDGLCSSGLYYSISSKILDVLEIGMFYGCTIKDLNFVCKYVEPCFRK